MPTPMRSWASVSVCAAVLCMGCSSARLADSNDSAPTLVKLSPSAFLGDLVCLPGSAGALQAYTVNLYELSEQQDGGVAGETLVNTSPPVSCGNAVSFQATSTRLYAADVFGYDRTPAPGVAPRWSAACGRGADGTGPAIDVGSNEYGATRANLNITVPMVGCTYLSEVAPGSTETRVVVNLASALGTLECGAGPGQVSDFVAALAGQTRAAACTGEATFSGVPLDTPLRIRVSAFSGGTLAGDAGASDGGASDASTPLRDASVSDAGADAAAVDASVPPSDAGADAAVIGAGRVPQWTTVCLARAFAGVVTRADCEPLQPVSN